MNLPRVPRSRLRWFERVVLADSGQHASIGR